MTTDRKIVPLGSECYVNAGLGDSILKDRKIYKSPFNGTRIVTNMLFPPVLLFFSSMQSFKKVYCCEKNWQIRPDGNDIQAYNYLLNLRRCHLKKGNEFSFIPEVEKTISFIIENQKDLLFLLDLNDYVIYDADILDQISKQLGNFNVQYFIRMHSLVSSIQSMKKLSKVHNFDKTQNCKALVNKFNPTYIEKLDNDDIKNYSMFFNQTIHTK